MNDIPNLRALRAFTSERGIAISDERPIDYGYQLKLARGGEHAGVNLYSSGKILIQGGASQLRRDLEGWKEQRAGQQPAAQARAAGAELLAPLPHIGVDESGKGDYFGPLAIAAVALDEEGARRLAALGVRDSKQLADDQIGRMAAQIGASCAHSLVLLAPEEYNRRHAALGSNLNRLLAWGHAEAIARVREQAPLEVAVCDQFGDERLVAAALRARGVSIELIQRPRAEADIAVAAASLLARAAFVDELARLGRAAGVALPLGASDLRAIQAAGRTIVERGGRAALGRVAKLHFKTTAQILG